MVLPLLLREAVITLLCIVLLWQSNVHIPIYKTPQSKVSTRLRRIPLASCLLMHLYSIFAMNASARASFTAISVHASMSDGPA